MASHASREVGKWVRPPPRRALSPRICGSCVFAMFTSLRKGNSPKEPGLKRMAKPRGMVPFTFTQEVVHPGNFGDVRVKIGTPPKKIVLVPLVSHLFGSPLQKHTHKLPTRNLIKPRCQTRRTPSGKAPSRAHGIAAFGCLPQLFQPRSHCLAKKREEARWRLRRALGPKLRAPKTPADLLQGDCLLVLPYSSLK